MKRVLLLLATLCCGLAASAEIITGKFAFDATYEYSYNTETHVINVRSLFPDGVGPIRAVTDVYGWKHYEFSEYGGTWLSDFWSLGSEITPYVYDVEAVIVEEGVTEIGDFFFANSFPQATSVSLPSTLRSIGNAAFGDLIKLKEIKIPESVTFIGHEAFEGCVDLASVNIPSGVKEINKRTFYNTHITSINIPDGTTIIDFEAFSLCVELTGIVMPNSVTSLGAGAFDDCPKLSSVVLSNKLKLIDKNTFQNCRALESIDLPEGIEKIEYGAFRETGLRELDFPESLRHIEEMGVGECKNLKKIHIKKNMIQVKAGAFQGSSNLSTILVDESPFYLKSDETMNAIVERAYHDGLADEVLITGCYKTVFPEGLDSIAPYACYEAYKKEDFKWDYVTLRLPEGVRGIGNGAFAYGDLIRNPKLPSTLEYIGSFAFSHCSQMVSLVIPRNVKYIGSHAFYYCYLASITRCEAKVPPYLAGYDYEANNPFYKASGQGAFYLEVPLGCSQAYWDSPYWDRFIMINEYIDESVPVSGQCGDNLYWRYDQYAKELNITGTGAMWDFELKPGTLVPDVPWYDFRGIIYDVSLPDGITHIGNYAFLDINMLRDITFPTSLQSIGSVAFAGTGFYNLEIPDWVTEIGSLAFSECTGLKTFKLPANLKKIEFGTFLGSKFMRSVELPKTLEEIESNAFQGCASLTEVTLPYTLKKLGDMVFYDCSDLTTITMTGCDVTTLPSQVFGRCSSLTNVSLPHGLTHIDFAPFWECTALKYLVLPETLVEIGEDAFVDCHSLEALRLPATVQKVGNHAFMRCYALTHIACDATTPPAMGRDVFDGVGHDVNIETSAPACMPSLGQTTSLRQMATEGPAALRAAAIALMKAPEKEAPDASKVTVYVPAASIDAYKAADEWKQFFNYEDLSAYEKFLEDNGFLNLDAVKAESADMAAKVLLNGKLYVQRAGRLYHMDGTPARF